MFQYLQDHIQAQYSEDDERREDNQSTQDDMILSGSIVNLNIK
jgi:hypothetical protein